MCIYIYIYIYIRTGLFTVTVPRKKAPFIARKKSLKIDFPCQSVRHFYLLQYLTVAQSPYGLAEPWIDWIDMSVQQLSLVRLMWRHAVNAITHFFHSGCLITKVCRQHAIFQDTKIQQTTDIMELFHWHVASWKGNGPWYHWHGMHCTRWTWTQLIVFWWIGPDQQIYQVSKWQWDMQL